MQKRNRILGVPQAGVEGELKQCNGENCRQRRLWMKMGRREMHSGSKGGNNRLNSAEIRLDDDSEPKLGVGCTTGWYAGDGREEKQKVKRSQSTSIYWRGLSSALFSLRPVVLILDFICIGQGSGNN